MRLRRLLAVVIGVLLAPASALAHDLRCSADIDATTVKIAAWYDDDTPAEKGKVTIADASGATVAAGVLDERGVWSFPRPAPGDYTVVVESVGHRDSLKFTIPRVEESDPVTYTSWRLDKRLGLAIGLGVLFGGSLLVWYICRRAQ